MVDRGCGTTNNLSVVAAVMALYDLIKGDVIMLDENSTLLKSENKKITLICIGKKGYDQLVGINQDMFDFEVRKMLFNCSKRKFHLSQFRKEK